MIKLPKCPHCSKLMVPHVSRAYSVDNGERGFPESKPVVTYLCPEKLFEMEVVPQWVGVTEMWAETPVKTNEIQP